MKIKLKNGVSAVKFDAINLEKNHFNSEINYSMYHETYTLRGFEIDHEDWVLSIGDKILVISSIDADEFFDLED